MGFLDNERERYRACSSQEYGRGDASALTRAWIRLGLYFPLLAAIGANGKRRFLNHRCPSGSSAALTGMR